ncbi:MAG: hypothetical protein OER86_05210 [Phycisphaerae bacterium]|nr:hypothetical protein [Phycisphaerae bacterium]
MIKMMRRELLVVGTLGASVGVLQADTFRPGLAQVIALGKLAAVPTVARLRRLSPTG